MPWRASLAAVLLSFVACAPESGTAAPTAAASSSSGGSAAGPAPQAEGVPSVVVELFSSEGCSSCPPAEAVLKALDADAPVSGAHVIALELHVDYWNSLGWSDPFSKAEFTERQRAYNVALGKRGVYTPQLVVDGAAELVGSDRRKAEASIGAAAAVAHVPVRLVRDGGTVTIDVASGKDEVLDVYLARTERGLATQVERGENAGRTLAHGPVVRSLVRIGETADGKLASSAPYEAGGSPGLVVLAVERATHRIRGAADLR
jgi:hypothetical protein